MNQYSNLRIEIVPNHVLISSGYLVMGVTIADPIMLLIIQKLYYLRNEVQFLLRF